MRGIAHIHTRYSWDSRIPIPTFTDGLLANDIGLAMVTDHNDFGGSLELRRFVSNAGIDIKVPVAAEVRTDRGDIVVVLESRVPPPVDGLLSWSSLPDIVRDLDGLTWLPHPYRSHIGVEKLAAEVDVIEVFNARCSAEQNASAQELCDKVGAVPAFGADVHRAELAASSSTTRGVPRFSKRSAVRRPAQNPGLPGGVMSCGLTNGVRQRRPALAGYFGLQWARHRATEFFSTASGS